MGLLNPFRPGSVAAPMFCMLALLAPSRSAAKGSVWHFRMWKGFLPPTVHGQLRSGPAYMKTGSSCTGLVSLAGLSMAPQLATTM